MIEDLNSDSLHMVKLLRNQFVHPYYGLWGSALIPMISIHKLVDLQWFVLLN
jgi:hypothetical protein